MNVDAILLSEAATLSVDNRLSVLNVFNAMATTQFPAPLPFMALSLIVHAHHSEGGTTHKLDIKVLNEKREIVAEVMKGFSFVFSDKTPTPGVPLRYTLVHGMMNVQFAAPGSYAFEVFIDGTYAAGTAFHVGQSAS